MDPSLRRRDGADPLGGPGHAHWPVSDRRHLRLPSFRNPTHLCSADKQLDRLCLWIDAVAVEGFATWSVREVLRNRRIGQRSDRTVISSVVECCGDHVVDDILVGEPAQSCDKLTVDPVDR